MVRELLWRIVAWIVSTPVVAQWLIATAKKRPYHHIHGQDGSLYMGRWWLFNPYPKELEERRWIHRLPSVRLHYIRRPDADPHKHDHPWDARTIILSDGYREVRRVDDVPTGVSWFPVWDDNEILSAGFWRLRGETAAIRHGEYHRIDRVLGDGAYTLFITFKKRGSWGFLVDGVKVPWRTYLGIAP